MKDSIIAVILTLCILNAGCLGEEEIDIFYGEDIVPAIHADDFTLTDEFLIILGALRFLLHLFECILYAIFLQGFGSFSYL